MTTHRDLLVEAIELLRERPCHRPQCISGELTDASHRLCQRIRSWIERAELAVAEDAQ